MLVSILLILLGLNIQAKPVNILPSYYSPEGLVVFSDFKFAHYKITYDMDKRSAFVESTIQLETFANGLIAFDSFQRPSEIYLDGKQVDTLNVQTPGKETTHRVINEITRAGKHELKINLPLSELVNFDSNGVRSAFWTSDLEDRHFLERYLPSSFEYDQVQISIDIEFVGQMKINQRVFTNGDISYESSNKVSVIYPAYFTSSSLYFHTMPKENISELTYNFSTIQKTSLPITLYLANTGRGDEQVRLNNLKDRTVKILKELELDYGVFPHPKLIIYNAGSGGMEYCGATITSREALGHELHHSYFARGVMPANGNAGWIDEAVASWRDGGYKTLSSFSGTQNLSNHGVYARVTDRGAYSFGQRFVSHLDYKFKDVGGMKEFLRRLLEERLFKPYTLDEIIELMEKFSGLSLKELFIKHTYQGSFSSGWGDKHEEYFHPKMSLEDLEQHL